MSFEVIHPGFLSLLQDAGRHGCRHKGMGEGGPADEHAFRWANRLLDNPPGAAGIEVTLGKLQLRATATAQFALAGADMDVHIDGRPASAWRVHGVAAGEVVSFETARAGLRAYLTVPGGFRIRPHYGSCSTVVRERVGGLHRNGEPLKAGDILPFDPGEPLTVRAVSPDVLPDYAAPLTLRVLPGYQFNDFPENHVARYFASEYTVGQDSDRMGYRLDGPPIRSSREGIVSEGISFGAIQVPPDGRPIVLMRDRQTIGGYPKLGCVASLDCSRLAQRPPGTKVRFRRVTLEEIVRERAEFDRFFAAGTSAVEP